MKDAEIETNSWQLNKAIGTDNKVIFIGILSNKFPILILNSTIVTLAAVYNKDIWVRE